MQPCAAGPMAAWVVERLQPQVGPLIINANQNLDRYAEFGCPSQSRTRSPEPAGPLAVCMQLSAARTPQVVTALCDSPFPPEDLVFRPFSASDAAAGAELAVARTFDQPHPVFCLCRREVLPHLTDFLESGGRKIDRWYATLSIVEVARRRRRRLREHQHPRRTVAFRIELTSRGRWPSRMKPATAAGSLRSSWQQRRRLRDVAGGRR